MLESSQIWWKEITGPKSFISDVTGQLLDSSLIVRVPDDLPWRHEMRQEIESELRELLDYAEISIIQIDADEEVPTGADVGAFILDRLALGEVARQYRKKSGKTIPQYIVEKQILKDDVLWIKGFNDDNVSFWLDFFIAFNACKPAHGRLVLELRDSIACRLPSTVKVIDYSSYISDYNLQLFCSLMLDRSLNWTENWKRYIAALASHTCVTDAEIAECFIFGFEQPDTDPVEVLLEIANDGNYVRRGAGKGSDHILALARAQNSSAIDRRIWEAQLQVLFPILESARIQLIVQIKDEITDLLKKREIKQFGDRIENPYEMEWGTLFYAMKLTNINDEYYLKSLTTADRDMIRKYRDCRNTLAHGECCSVSQVCELLTEH